MNKRGAWRIGGYVADELIGYGASAQVWRGHVARSSEPVALKVLNLADAQAVRAARAEAAILSALDHPHLVRLRELVPDGESIVLVLELADGGSLAELVERRGRLSPGEVVAAVAPVAAALAYIHDEGVVHADVSPANILFRSDGTPILADLGVARVVGGFGAPRSTLAFVDPGVAAGGVPSPASDVFMAAATALCALTGAPPWRGESAEEVLAQAALGEIDRLEARLSGLPAPLAEVIGRGLSASPEARLSAAEFALDLRHCVPPIPVDLRAGRARPPATRGRVPAHNDTVAPDDVGSGDPAPPSGRLSALDLGGMLSAREGARQRTRIRSRLIGGRRGAADSPVLGRTRAGAAIHVPRHAARPDPTGPEPARPEPARPEPARPEPARPEPARPEPARPSLARSGPLGSAPARTDAPSAVATSRSRQSASRVQAVEFDRPAFARPQSPGLRDKQDAEPAPARDGAREADAGPRDDTRSPAGGDQVGGSGASERLALTHVVRARVRRSVPEPSPRRWPPSPPVARVVAALTVVLVLATAGIAWLQWGRAWASGSHRAGASGSNGPKSATAAQTPSASSATSAAPTTVPSTAASATASVSPTAPSATATATQNPSSTPNSTPAASQSGAGRWVAVLDNLDRRRQRAFATRDPLPLSSVYVSGPLLTEDAQTLRRVVAPGCRLLGLRTEYQAVHASAGIGGRVVLAARASLASAKLECPGLAPRRTSVSGPVPMTLVLVRRGSDYLISSISLPP